MVSVVTVTIFKQTLIPIVNYLKCFGYGSSKDHSSEVRRYRTKAKECLEETQGLPSGQESGKPARLTANEPSSFIKSLPIRFYPEQSMHRSACPDFSKNRLHSLPITKSLENPVTCETPWTQFLGGCRWYSQEFGKGPVKLTATRFKTKFDMHANRFFKEQRR